jgi:hypothetical protein
MNNIIPEDITKIAIDVSLEKENLVEHIAQALLAERNANKNEISNWREKYRTLKWNELLDSEIVTYIRKWTKEIVGINATFADDDLRVLCHLADLAVQHELTNGLNTQCREAIINEQLKRRATNADINEG